MKNTAPCTHGEWQKLPSMACTVYHRMGHSTMNQQPHVGVSVAGQALALGCGKWLCARVTMMPLDAVVLSSTCGWPPVHPVRGTCRVRDTSPHLLYWYLFNTVTSGIPRN